MNSTAKLKNHDFDIDFMRIIATFFVVMIHSSDIHYFSGIVYNAISRFSVPVFVLISGSYLLSSKPNMRYLSKKIAKLFLIMLIWSAIYYLYHRYRGNLIDIGPSYLITYLLTEPVHLWYIYATIGLYLFAPVFYVFAKNANRKEYLYGIFLSFIFGSIAVIAVRSGIFPIISIVLDKMKVAYTLGFVCLYLIGGYFRKHEIKKKTCYIIYLFGLIGVIITIVGTLMLAESKVNHDLLLSFYAPNVLIAGIAFYLLIKRYSLAHPIKQDKARFILFELSSCTMGVYLLHPLILLILQNHPLFASGRQIIAIPLKTSVVFLLSVAIVYCLRKIPALRWLV